MSNIFIFLSLDMLYYSTDYLNYPTIDSLLLQFVGKDVLYSHLLCVSEVVNFPSQSLLYECTFKQ